MPLWPLLPLSWLFGAIGAWRRWAYRRHLLPSYRLPVPVIVVGNLTVGGSGKTPLVLWLVEELRQAGWQPGIISRGYGSDRNEVRPVVTRSTAAEVGDEPLLLARRAGVPVFVGRDRVAAGRALLAAHPHCNLLLSDDGLQHYRLQRDGEVVLFDGRGVGNGRLLPAGPLREPLRRLATVSAVVWNGIPDARLKDQANTLPQFTMTLNSRRFVAVSRREANCDADSLQGRRLYAVAGIGDPSRFFRQLTALGLAFEAHPFPDHHRYRATDLDFSHDGVLLMTEKDAVKCETIVTGEAWALPVDAEIGAVTGRSDLIETLLEILHGRPSA
ncbi:MAG TPA: tetraacyldisaccharide 4'-kinase [Accumulibacter sp.]|nr:tetraacyldisaccharide 4'-kinase [Accumulibacter sp.]HMY07268.1 tetraacyldisaccharide 4'-kinase [Accumulibacter sp.]HNC17468.1 tetraacyldisaccharide 4'-kinase [Accumulibacter sp.]HND79187.1 tetraacyldisaccharide 4'-kinase [Accumulibacter sp.]HNE13466.1 tetraacyldisaccharide 4'-kinase [Accumulibacter sp.]